MGKSDENTGFTVTDRRSSAGAAPGASPETAPHEPPMPPVEFATFVLSLGSSALLHLGELEEPMPGDSSGASTKVDLALAKNTIDVLVMLQEKTRGNLTTPEATLLENLLFDLRLRFVETSAAQKSKRG